MKENKLNTLFGWFFLSIVFLLPIFFLPNLIIPFINSKLLLLFTFSLIVFFAFLVRTVRRKNFSLTKGPFFWPLLAFGLLVIISSLMSHQYPAKQLLGMGGVYLSFITIALLLPSLIKQETADKFKNALNLAAIVLSVFTIAQLFGFGPALIFNRIYAVELPNTLAFALTGASFITIQFLSAVLLGNVLDQKNFRNSWLIKISAMLATIAIGINIWAVLPGGPAHFQSLSLAASANISRNSLTLTKNALFGYGPDSYSNAYNILKPVWINGLSYWNFIFDSAFNLPLTIIVSLGSIAFLVYLWLLWQIVKAVKESKNSDIFLKTVILISLLWQFLAPANVLMLAILALALALLVTQNQDKYKSITFKIKRVSDLLNHGKWVKKRSYLFYGVAGLLMATGVFATVGVFRAFAAYNLLYQSNASVNKNEIAKAYDYHKQAKALAPQLDFVRRSYALVNLQIAIAISNKADITPAEQDQVLQLVNQAIREARAATVLDPQNYLNWSVLAQIYMQLLNTTDQAKQEAFNALARAATYNPNSPEVRLALGQVFANTNRNSEAITFFNQAIERKPDLFVAHYYMAKTLLKENQSDEAASYLRSSLNLLDQESEEYRIIEKELSDLIEKESAAKEDASMETEEASSASNLSSILDQQNAESLIQEGALSSDQSLVEN